MPKPDQPYPYLDRISIGPVSIQPFAFHAADGSLTWSDIRAAIAYMPTPEPDMAICGYPGGPVRVDVTYSYEFTKGPNVAPAVRDALIAFQVADADDPAEDTDDATR